MAETQACKLEKCKRPYRAKGYCDVHFKKWRRGELVKGPYKTCLTDTCRKKQHLKSLCEEHYKAAYEKKEAAPAAAEAAPAPAPAAEAAPSA